MDLETHDPELKERGPGWAFNNGHIVGIALAWGHETIEDQGYWPFAHNGGNWQGDHGKFKRWLRRQMDREDLEWTFANASYDLGWIKKFPVGKFHDVQVQAPLLNEHRFSFALDGLAMAELGVGKDETLMKEFAKKAGLKGNPKGMMALMPSWAVGPYAEQDAVVTWQLHKAYMPRLSEQNLGSVYNLEMNLLPMLMEMRQIGVPVDVPGAEQLRETVLIEERNSFRELRRLTGFGIDPWDLELQIRALRAEGFNDFPLTPKKKKPSLTAGVLEALSHQKNKAGQIARQILDLRRKNRQRVTFIERLILDHHKDGRIHAQFNQLKSESGGTVSGRFSSSDPNLQQLPARDEEASSRIRGLFTAEQDALMASVDYASQEPRLAIHWAVEGGSKVAARMAREFHENPRLDLHQKVANIMSIKRSSAKILNLAQMYGQGGGSLALALGLDAFPDSFVNDDGKEINYLAPGREAKKILQEYNDVMPFMKTTAKATQREAQEQGFITTLLGRRCRVFRYKDDDGNYSGDDSRKMFNRRIQGSAADMIKKAMLDAWKAGYKVRMTVHDENVFSVQNQKEARECVEIMNAAVSICVPVVCDLAIGKTWGAMEELV
jgi:DNA polymerase I-like protein with 3'-5' exonuclease and polymerase domains